MDTKNKLSPGRDLDALVAEKVMGWRRDTGTYPNGMTWLAADGTDTEWYLTEYGSQECDPFSPSTDMFAAWVVVERIKYFCPASNDFGIGPDRHQKFTLRYDDGIWECGWEPINFDGVMPISAEAETATHAICLAALKVSGVNVD